jgi:hypothetical protein
MFNNKEFPPCTVVLVCEQEGHIIETSIELKDISRLLKGTATIQGAYPEMDVVVLRCDETPFDLMRNQNMPEIVGPALFIRMDENSEPQDFTLDEYWKLMNDK